MSEDKKIKEEEVESDVSGREEDSQAVG